MKPLRIIHREILKRRIKRDNDKNLKALSESQSVSDNETKEKICHADEDGISHNGCVSQPSCDECSAFR